jgi:hypothetical protein
VSDTHQETSRVGTTEPDVGREPADDVGSQPQYETGEPAGQSYREHTETDAEVQARIAGQDELPALAESRQVTWGDNPEYYDETEPGAEYDGDVDAFLARQDQLPTPQESRARTWGDNPDYYDETDLASEYDGDHGAVTTEEDSPAARRVPASPETKDADAESAIAPEDTTGSPQGTDAGHRDQNAASSAGDQSAPARTDLAVTELGRAQDGQATADTGTGAASRPDRAELPRGDDRNVLSPETDRLKALETEHDAARQKIADLEAELKAVKDEQVARLDRIEQLLASTDRPQLEGANPPEHRTGQPDATRNQDASIDERRKSEEQRDTADAKPARWRRIVSSENAGIASALIGATGTVSDFVMHATPAGAVGLGATAFGLVSLGLAKIEKNRNVRHDRPDQS